MSDAQRLGLDAIARIVARLDVGAMSAGERATLRAFAGIEAQGPAAARERAPRTTPSRDGEREAARRSRAERRARRRAEIEAERTAPPLAPLTPMRTRLTPLIPAPAADAPPWYAFTAPIPLAAPPAEAQRPQPILPKNHARGILLSAVRTNPVPGEVDVERMAARIAKAQPIARIERLSEWSAAQDVVLVKDCSGAMDAFRDDMVFIGQALRRLVGSSVLDEREVLGWPPARLGAASPGSVLVVISDLSLLPAPERRPRARALDWAAWAHARRADGWTVVALTPAPPSLWPRSLSDAMALIHLTETANARSAKAAREHARPAPAVAASRDEAGMLAALETCVTLAARLDNAAVRALRVAVAGPGTAHLEALLRNRETVRARNAAALTLTDEAVRAGRERAAALSREGDGPQAAALRALAALGPGRALHHSFEERLVRLCLDGEAALDAIRDELRAATKTVLERTDQAALDLAVWVMRALPRVPIPDAALEDASVAFHAAARASGAVATVREAVGALPAPAWLREDVHEAALRHPVVIDWQAQMGGVFDDDDPRAAAGTAWIRTVRALGLREGVTLPSLDVPDDGVGGLPLLSFSPDGRRLLQAAPRGQGVLVADVAGGGIRRLAAPDKLLSAAAFTPDGLQLVTGSLTGTIDVWDASSGERLASHSPVSTMVGFIAAPDQATAGVSEPVAVAGLIDGTVLVISLASGATLGWHNMVTSDVDGVVMRDGDVVGASSWMGEVVVTAEGRTERFSGRSLRLTPDGSQYAFLEGAERDTKAIAFVDATTLTQTRIVAGADDATTIDAFAISPDGETLASVQHPPWSRAPTEPGPYLVLRDLATLEAIPPTDLPAGGGALAFSPDGARLAVRTTETRIYDLVRPQLSLAGEMALRSRGSVAARWPAGAHAAVVEEGGGPWICEPADDATRAVKLPCDAPRPSAIPAASWWTLTSPGGTRLRIEDVDVADARAPLRVHPIFADTDRERVEPLLAELETALRAEAGLSPFAVVLSQPTLAPRGETDNPLPWDGDAKTRALALDRAAEAAPAVVAFASEADVSDDVQYGLERIVRDVAQIVLVAEPSLEPLGRRVQAGVREQGLICSDVWTPDDFRKRMETEGGRRGPGAMIGSVLLLPGDFSGPLLETLLIAEAPLSPILIVQCGNATDEAPFNLGDVLVLSDDDMRNTMLAEKSIVRAIFDGVAVPQWRANRNAHLLDLDPQSPRWSTIEGWTRPATAEAIHAAAASIARDWRETAGGRGGSANEDAAQPSPGPFDFRQAPMAAEALQTLAMAFHLSHYAPRLADPSRSGADPDNWGLDAGEPVAAAHHEYVWYLAEGVFSGPVRGGVSTGADPGVPMSVGEITENVTRELAALVEPETFAYPQELRRLMRAFARFATPHELRRHHGLFGDAAAVERELHEMVGTPPPAVAQWARRAERRIDDLAALLAPYSSTLAEMASHVSDGGPTTLPVTLVEFVEDFCGRFDGLLRRRIRSHPDTAFWIDSSEFEIIFPLVNDALPAWKLLVEEADPLREWLEKTSEGVLGEPPAAVLPIPITLYRDTVDHLSTLVIAALRARRRGVAIEDNPAAA